MKKAGLGILVSPLEVGKKAKEDRDVGSLFSEIFDNSFDAKKKKGAGDIIKVYCHPHRHLVGEFYVWERETILARMASHTVCCALIP